MHIVLIILVGALVSLFSARDAQAQCGGDCNGDGRVVINELITGVNIALEHTAVSQCPSFDTNHDDWVTVNELILAVNNALGTCPPTPTATSTVVATATDTAPVEIDTPTATHTAVPPTLTATVAENPTSTETTLPPATDTATAPATATATAIIAETATETVTVEPTSTATETPETSATVTATTEATATASAMAMETATATHAPDPATPTATFTTTPTPTEGSTAECGNGLLEPGETCQSCAADCTVSACTASATSVTFAVQFTGVLATIPTTATTLVGYRSSRVSIPGTGNVVSVRQRVTFPPPLPNVASPNDLDYAIRVVIGRNSGLADGLLYSLRFDTCQGAPAVTAADFACTIEACAGAGGPIDGCTCTVTAP